MKLLSTLGRALGLHARRNAPARHASALVAGLPAAMPGYGPPAPGDYATYRLMRSHPTLAMARLIATTPLRAARVRLRPRHATPEQLALLEPVLDAAWPGFIHHACDALDFGWKGFEKVFALHPRGWITLEQLRPLCVDQTTILADADTGRFLGLRQNGVDLPACKTLVVTHDMEDDNRYGRSRHENVRAVWNAWNDLLEKEGRYVGKVAGVVPIIKYPEGSGRDQSGATRSNFELAQAVLSSLGRGHGVAMPNSIASWAEDFSRAGVDVAPLAAWQIQFLEAGTSHGHSFIEQMRHKESLMMRGWLVPERTALESSAGSRADAEAHGAVAAQIAAATLGEVLRLFNRYVIDHLLVLNWGPDARGAAAVETLPDGDDGQTRLLRDVARDALADPSRIELLQRVVRLDELLARAGLPVREKSA